MGTRAQLDQILRAMVENVYFQPGPSVQMKYPCIVYKRVNDDSEFADNSPYKVDRRYNVTVIDPNPDTEIPDKVVRLPLCVSDRDYTVNNLNHYSYNLYF